MQVASRSGGGTGTSAKIMKKVKRELETNKLLIADYGIERGSDWSKEHIQVKRADGHEIDFYSVGKHSSIRGSRGTVLIDDPQNSADCRSETVLAADEDWLLTDVVPVIIGDQRLIFIGTVISELSLLRTVQELEDFVCLEASMDEPSGSRQSVWPEMYSDEFLEARYRILGEDRYLAEYSCQPGVPGTPVFRREWFPGYEPDSEKFLKGKRDGFFVTTGFDGADSKKTQADNTGIVTIGTTAGAKPEHYVLDVRRNKFTTKEGAQELFRVQGDFHMHVTTIESRCSYPDKDAIIEEVESLEHTYGRYLNVYQVKPLADKVTRAHIVQPTCQTCRVFFNLKDPKQQWLLKELIMFTGDGTFSDDLVDAFVMALVAALQRARGGEDQEVKSALAGAWA